MRQLTSYNQYVSSFFEETERENTRHTETSFAQRGNGLWTEEIEATANLESEFLKASKKKKEGERVR